MVMAAGVGPTDAAERPGGPSVAERVVRPASADERPMMRPASADERPAPAPLVALPDHGIVLGDGTRVWRAEGQMIMTLQDGVTVKLSYEERGGQHVVTSIESAE
jgi:hypothetical protein